MSLCPSSRQTLVTPLIPGRGQLALSLKQRGLGERYKLPQCGTSATESTFSLLTFSVTTRLDKKLIKTDSCLTMSKQATRVNFCLDTMQEHAASTLLLAH